MARPPTRCPPRLSAAVERRRLTAPAPRGDGRALNVASLLDRDLLDAGLQIVTTRDRVVQEATAVFFHGDGLDAAAERAHRAYRGTDAPGLASALHLMRSRVRSIAAAVRSNTTHPTDALMSWSGPS